MKPIARSFRPHFELLENRLTPAGNVTAFVTNGTLNIIGDIAANDIVVNRDLTFNQVQVASGANATSINRQIGPKGFFLVSSIRIRLDGGNDTVTFNGNNTPLAVPGFIAVFGSTGNNTVRATDLSVGRNLVIINPLNGNATNTFTNVTVAGNLSITNNAPVGIQPAGIGNNVNTFTSTAGSSGNNIKGNLTILNGIGFDNNTLEDINVGGAVTLDNASGGANNLFFNVNDTARSNLGSLVIVNESGPVVNSITDVGIFRNATIRNGTSAAQTTFTNTALNLPPLVGGNLTIFGAGGNTINLTGGAGGFPIAIGGSLTILAGDLVDQAAMNLTLNNVQVVGGTSINSGQGDDVVAITNCTFNAAFSLFVDDGNDNVTIQGVAGNTIFGGFTSVRMGLGANTLTLAPNVADQVTLLRSAVFDGGGNTPLPAHPGLIPPLPPFTVVFVNFV